MTPKALRQKAIDIRLKDYYRSGGIGASAVTANEKAKALEDRARAMEEETTWPAKSSSSMSGKTS